MPMIQLSSISTNTISVEYFIAASFFLDIPRFPMYPIYIEYLGIGEIERGGFVDKKMMTMSTSMLILKLLEEKDMYGYQMIRTLERRSNQVFSLKEGTLYPVLHSLEEQEAVESYERTAETGRMRKYYHLTKKGGKLLKEKQKDWEVYERAVRDVMGGGVSFAFQAV